MKNALFVSLVVGSVSLSPLTSQSAAPVAEGNDPSRYMLAARNLNAWGMGAYIESLSRAVEVSLADDSELKSQRAMVYVSFAPISWVSVYAAGGTGRYKLTPGSGDYSDEKAQWGAGFRMNLLDHDVLDSTLLEDRVRLNANANYTRAKGSWDGGDSSWNELSASLTVSIVNDIVGNKAFLPYGMSVFVGPLWSLIDGSDVESDDEMGFVGGLQVHLTHRVTLSTSIEYIDDASVAAGVDVRF